MDTEKCSHHGMTLYGCIKDSCPICERDKRIAELEGAIRAAMTCDTLVQATECLSAVMEDEQGKYSGTAGG